MIIKRQAIAAALPATTSDDTRYFLKALELRPDGTVVSTNGHLCVMVRDTEPYADADFPIVPGAPFHGSPAKAVLIDGDVAKRMIAATPKKSSIPILKGLQVSRNGSDDTATVAATDLDSPMVSTLKDEGQTFPDCDRVRPKLDDQPTIEVGIGIPVLEAMIKAVKALQTDKRAPMVKLVIPIGRRHRDVTPGEGPEIPTSGALIGAFCFKATGSDGLQLDGIAMPMRI